MEPNPHRRTAPWHRSRSVGYSAVPAILAAAMPKCPLCWMALTGALGLGSVISSDWLRPLAACFLLLSLAALFARARRSRSYAPFLLGLAAAAAVYLFKFRLGSNAGVYLSAVILIGASVWTALSERRAAARCRC